MDTPVSRAKESWMEPLQPTVRQGVVQLKDFITKLVDIEEKEGKDFTMYHAQGLCASLLRDPASALPTKTKPNPALLFCFRRVSSNPGLVSNSLPRITLNPISQRPR